MESLRWRSFAENEKQGRKTREHLSASIDLFIAHVRIVFKMRARIEGSLGSANLFDANPIQQTQFINQLIADRASRIESIKCIFLMSTLND